MPELPEVETVKRGLEPHCLGQSITACSVHCEKLRFPFDPDFQTKVMHSEILDIQRRGKFMIFLFANDNALIWHLGMSGRVSIFEKPEEHIREKHDHVVFDLSNGVRVVYNDPRRFGFMVLDRSGNWQNASFFSKMGPEPLGNSFSGQVLYEAVKGKSCDIKAALLDQRVISGIGNIYACEALYYAGISPKRKAGSISAEKCNTLAVSIRDVLNKALAAGGSSLKDYKHTDGSLGYFQHSFSVYDREGRACPDCSCDIERSKGVRRIVQAGRSTFYCPEKQK